MKYRKISPKVDVIQFRRDWFEDIKAFTNNKAYDFRTEKRLNGKSCCEIETPQGILHVVEGYYILKDAHGKISLCRPDIFERTYEEVEEMTK